MDAVSFRAVGGIEQCREPGGPDFGKVGNWAQFFRLWNNSINASFILASAHIEPGQPLGRNPPRMLDHEAVHIHDIKGAIRTGARLNGTTPVIARGEKLGLLLIRCAISADGESVLAQPEPMHEVMDWFAREFAAVKVSAEKIVAIDAHAATRGDPVG